MLLDSGITPIMVFDGGPLPAKNETNKIRKEYIGMKLTIY